MGDALLVADIGGTNARFALADPHAATPLLADSVREFPVAAFPSLAEAAAHYLDQVGTRARRGVFAVAGRIDGDQARITNHPWVISRSRTAQMLGFDQVHLLNDFAAQAMAIRLFGPDDVVRIGAPDWSPAPPEQARTYAVLGPGTGLGVGGLIVRDGRCRPLQTEGGHVSFPPGTPEELDIHRALCQIAGVDPGLPTPRDISERAAAGDALGMRAVDVFCAVFGAIAGDLVLTLGAWDGVFLTGGLVPRMLDSLLHSGFRQRFEAKGRFSPNMAQVPSLAVMHPQAGLLGAAAWAADLLEREAT